MSTNNSDTHWTTKCALQAHSLTIFKRGTAASSRLFPTLGAVALCAVFSLSLGAPASSQAQQNYSVVDLGALAPGNPSVAFSISDDGNVVGYYVAADGSFRAVEWQNATTSPKLVKLNPSAKNSIAFSINYKSGKPIIVGEINPSGFQEAERFDKSLLLDPVNDAASIFNIAYNSNDVETIVGVSGLPSDPPNAHAVVFSSSPPFNLGNFGTDNSVAYDVNNDFNNIQHVVGTAATASGPSHAFFHTGISTQLVRSDDLGTLGGPNSEATCINKWNQVAGWSNVAKCKVGKSVSHAFLWDATNGKQDLGTPTFPARVADPQGHMQNVRRVSTFTRLQNTSDREGGECMNGREIQGFPPQPMPQIVGYAQLFYGPPPTGFAAACHPAYPSFTRAFMYDGTQPAGSQMIDLNTRIPHNPEWYLSYAWGINNSGQIVGEGRIGGLKHAFLLMPM